MRNMFLTLMAVGSLFAANTLSVSSVFPETLAITTTDFELTVFGR